MEEGQLQEVGTENEEVDLTEVSQQISELVEVMQTEQELKAEEQAKLEEEQALMQEQQALEEQQQAELTEQEQVQLEQEATAEEEYNQAVLNALNLINTNLDENEAYLLEIKDTQQELLTLHTDMSGYLVYGAIALIVCVCLVPSIWIVRVLAKLFNRFL